MKACWVCQAKTKLTQTYKGTNGVRWLCVDRDACIARKAKLNQKNR